MKNTSSPRRNSTEGKKSTSNAASSTKRRPSESNGTEGPEKSRSRRGSTHGSSVNNQSTEKPGQLPPSSRRPADTKVEDAKERSQTGEAGETGGPTKFGRRAHNNNNSGASNGGGRDNGWFDASKERPKDQLLGNVPTINAEVDEAARQEQQRRAKEEREKLSKQIADAPTNYQATMPRLADLDIKNSWDKLLQTIHSEYDMSCLTACLARELDEDITWNPDMLLVQLMSDMRDANEIKADGEGMSAFNQVDKNSIGMMAGGEVVRRRKERTVAGRVPGENGGDEHQQYNNKDKDGSGGASGGKQQQGSGSRNANGGNNAAPSSPSHSVSKSGREDSRDGGGGGGSQRNRGDSSARKRKSEPETPKRPPSKH